MTTAPRHISDPDRSLTRELSVRSLPQGVRVAVTLLVAALFLWPLGPLLVEAASTEAWSGAVWSAAWFSLWQAALAATVGVGLSIPIGWSLARLAVPARRLIRALCTLPVVAPLFGVALGASWLLEGRSSLLLLVHAGFGLAVGVRLGGAAWLALDPRESETARTLGLSRVQIARWYLVPTLGRAYLAVWALAVALAVSAYGAAHLLATPSGSAPNPTLPELAGTVTAGTATPTAGAAALLLLLVVAAATVVFLRFRPDHAMAAGDPEYQPLGEVATQDRLLLAGAFLLAGLLVLGPIAALVHGTLTIGAAEQVTGANVAALFGDTRPFEVNVVAALQRSLVLGTAAVLIALPLGLVVAVLVAPLRGWLAVTVEAALLLPLLLAVPFAAGLRSAGLDSPFWLLFVHLAIAFPLVLRVVLPGARAQLHSQFEAATLLGASPWESWNRLAARSVRGHLAVAAVLAMTWSLGEVGAGLLLSRLDAAPASVAVIRSLEQQSAVADGRAVALATVLVLFVAIVFVTIEYRRSREITEF